MAARYHLERGRGIGGRLWIVVRETLPTEMVGFPLRGDGREDVPGAQTSDGFRVEVAVVQSGGLGHAQCGGDGVHRGRSFPMVRGMVGEGVGQRHLSFQRKNRLFLYLSLLRLRSGRGSPRGAERPSSPTARRPRDSARCPAVAGRVGARRPERR